MIDAGVTPERLLQDYFSKISLEDLLTMKAILTKYSSDVAVPDSDGFSTLGQVTGPSSSPQ